MQRPLKCHNILHTLGSDDLLLSSLKQLSDIGALVQSDLSIKILKAGNASQWESNVYVLCTEMK